MSLVPLATLHPKSFHTGDRIALCLEIVGSDSYYTQPIGYEILYRGFFSSETNGKLGKALKITGILESEQQYCLRVLSEKNPFLRVHYSYKRQHLCSYLFDFVKQKDGSYVAQRV